MKKIILIALIAISTVISANAQDKRADRIEKMLEYKVNFVKEKLGLTKQEESDFLPIYQEFLKMEMDAKIEFRSEKGSLRGEKQLLSEKSEEEIEKELNAHIAQKEKGIAIDKEYLAKFKSVLPIKKVAQLYEAEREFRKELLDKLRDKNEGGKGMRENERPMHPSHTN